MRGRGTARMPAGTGTAHVPTAKPNRQPLTMAIEPLAESLRRYQENAADLQIRDGLIQRFDFTDESHHWRLKRDLEFQSATPEQYEAVAFHEPIRSAIEQDLLRGDWPAWRT